MSEKKRVVESSTAETPSRAEIPEERRCTHVFADGRKCRQRRWAGKKLCYQHDKSAEGAQKPTEGGGRDPGFTVAQVQELLAMALAQALSGRMPVGRAYAIGYLAQQSLAAQAAATKERKLDVKHYWEMVELAAAFERAAELKKEREKEKKAKEGKSFAAQRAAQDKEAGDAEEGEQGEETEQTEEQEDAESFDPTAGLAPSGTGLA